MTKIDTSEYNRFSDVTNRLDEIIDSVRDKDTSLERSLDLFDEAIALGTRAVDLVDKAAFSPEERERLSNESTTSAQANASDASVDELSTNDDSSTNKESNNEDSAE